MTDPARAPLRERLLEMADYLDKSPCKLSRQREIAPLLREAASRLGEPEAPAPSETDQSDLKRAASMCVALAEQHPHGDRRSAAHYTSLAALLTRAAAVAHERDEWRQNSEWNFKRLQSLNHLYEDALIKLHAVQAHLSSAQHGRPVESPVSAKCKACNGTGGGENRMGGEEWACDVCHGSGKAAESPVSGGTPISDLRAYGEQESQSALSRKDRDQYQFWQGWIAALDRADAFPLVRTEPAPAMTDRQKEENR